MNNTSIKAADMPPEQIRVQFLLKRVTQMDIARSLGISHTMVCKVIEGKSVSHRVRTAIAETLEIDIKRIWPSTYLYGVPKRRGRPRSKGLKK